MKASEHAKVWRDAADYLLLLIEPDDLKDPHRSVWHMAEKMAEGYEAAAEKEEI